MAIVTYLMAKSFGKPMVLLPDVVLARFQHGHALYNAKAGKLTPRDLNNKRVGIRSFTTTSGAWLRGILANDHGVDLCSIDWVTFEDAHVAEFVDTTKRAPAGKQIMQMLIDRELDAVLGEKSDHPDLKPLFADVIAEEEAWFGKHRVVPINHMVVVSQASVGAASGNRARSSSPAGGIGCDHGSVRPRCDAALAGIDHRLLRAAKAHSARVHRGRVVRRRHAGALVTLTRLSSSAKADDPVLRGVAVILDSAAYWIPAFAGYDGRKLQQSGETGQ